MKNISIIKTSKGGKIQYFPNNHNNNPVQFLQNKKKKNPHKTNSNPVQFHQNQDKPTTQKQQISKKQQSPNSISTKLNLPTKSIKQKNQKFQQILYLKRPNMRMLN